jgi:glucans biosynthesis protein
MQNSEFTSFICFCHAARKHPRSTLAMNPMPAGDDAASDGMAEVGKQPIAGTLSFALNCGMFMVFIEMLDDARFRKVAGVLAVGVAALCFPAQSARAAGEEAPRFAFSTVRELARALAAKDFQPPQNADLPEVLKKLTYDQYQSIRFRPEQSLWTDDHVRFTAQFFSRGYLYQDPVKVHVIDGGRVNDVAFSAKLFDYAANRIPENLPASLQFAGFRLLYPLNSPQKMDEAAEFLGASYFRVLGVSQRYGASLRGLAIDTGEPSGEEFPRFTEFWLEKPGPLAGGIRVFALMDSPSMAGAYCFVIEPGAATVVQVETSLFFRKSPKKIGVGSLSSLFLMGQNRTRFVPDYRPQVHDSDGLQIESGAGDWIWRPLVNPAKTFQISRFPVAELKGFGLMQRDREFSDYDDLGSRFDLRPSYWIEPGEGWGPGAVELVEIPTANEWNDNMVAYWTPPETPAPGHELHLTYRLSALLAGPEQKPLLRVRSTRITPEISGSAPRFIIDFAGTPPHPIGPDTPPAAKVHASAGQVRDLVVQTNDASGGWRAFFELAGAGDNRTELRLRLEVGNAPVSETWVYEYQKSN